MICKRVALPSVLVLTMLTLTLAACGPKAGDDAAAPGGAGGAGGAPAAQGGAAAGGAASTGDKAGGSAAGAGAAVSDSQPVGMISSGAVERPTEQPTPVKPVQLADSKPMKREELLKAATMPLFELPRASDDDQFNYYWVTARDGDADPTLPMARMVVTLNYTNAFVLSEWAAKDGAEMAQDGEPTAITVGGAPGKLWVQGKTTVISWDNGATRLQMKSNTFDKDGLLAQAAKLVPMK